MPQQNKRFEAIVEKGCVIQACRPLRDPQFPMRRENVPNLTVLAEAAVCFDTTYLPYHKGPGPSPMQIIPEGLSSGVFQYEQIDDADVLMDTAKQQSIALARSSIGDMGPITMTDGQLLLELVTSVTKKWGDRWYDALMEDSRSILQVTNDYEKAAMKRALSHFSGDEYAGLSDTEKIAIFHLWRSFYNLTLADRYDRIWLHNEVRAPLIEEVLSVLQPDDNDRTTSPGNSSCGAATRPKRPHWRQASSALLFRVLKEADCRREGIPEAIMKIRNEPAAREFRNHFRRIRRKRTARGTTEALEKDAQRALQLWARIRCTGERSVDEMQDVVSKGLATSFLNALLQVRSVPYLFITCKHMRLLWQNQDDNFKNELEFMLTETFPELRGSHNLGLL